MTDDTAAQHVDRADEDRHEHGHPALERIHTEFAAARLGIAQIGTMTDDVHRDRLVRSIRTELPDVASRSAHEVGGTAVLAEIHRFAHLAGGADPGAGRTGAEPVDRLAAVLWDAILADATEAVRATCPVHASC
ncbi:hypothetical protein [Curtobacterium sp. RRHDQ10]|uniref:hypothetical protein n=1 Tax=Curtobacterium phyllosphaerae TaxID=3413379 RepID=UPI003BEFCC40